MQRLVIYEFVSSYRQTYIHTESNAYEPNVHTHRWAQKWWKKLGFSAFPWWFRIENRTIIKETMSILVIHDTIGYLQTRERLIRGGALNWQNTKLSVYHPAQWLQSQTDQSKDYHKKDHSQKSLWIVPLFDVMTDCEIENMNSDWQVLLLCDKWLKRIWTMSNLSCQSINSGQLLPE